MNFAPTWGTPLKRRRRRRRLKTKVYVIILVGTVLIVLHVYQNWQWNEFRKSYWAEELIVFDGGSLANGNGNTGSSFSASSAASNLRGTNENPNSNNDDKNAAPAATDTNPNAKWNPEIVYTHDVHQLSKQEEEKSAAADNDKNSAGAAFLRDSRQSIQFSDFVKNNMSNSDTADADEGVTYEQAKEGREPLLEILEQDLGLAKLTTSELLQLPRWSEIQDLYGDKPIIQGLDMCLKYQMKVPMSDRYIGVAGSFNTGTTAFGLSLQQNCRFPNRRRSKTTTTNAQQAGNGGGTVVSNVHGMLNQVPWAKHKMAYERFGHTIDDSIPKENVLPVVLVRDPYYWMQSMCKQGYGVRWDHKANKHCPNLVPNDFDLKRFPKRYATNTTSVPVWMGQSYQSGPRWDSLVHYWNDWYGSYYYKNGAKSGNAATITGNKPKEEFPRLMIRFEDTLFHAKTVMKLVCACGGGIFSGNEEEEEEGEVNLGFTMNANENAKQQQQQHPTMGGGSAFRPILDEAKFEHKHIQNNLVSAIVKYGSDKTRYRNMTKEDLDFAESYLDSELMKAFHYKLFKE